MKPLLVTSGEPAGIGPDICLSLAASPHPLVVFGDLDLLKTRAHALNLDLIFDEYHLGDKISSSPHHLAVLSKPSRVPSIPGQLDARNAPYVLDLLTDAVDFCLNGDFAALITAPVHKAILNQKKVPFTGHTEFLAEACHVKTVVMLLVCRAMRVALITTHIPLYQVPSAVTQKKIIDVVLQLHTSLRDDFGIESPHICVAGLNPHAGEDGHLGYEERDVIEPACAQLKAQGLHVTGPYPADTMFVAHKECDAFVAMYHDQGLSVLKYAAFGHAVNVTLGLPFIRTSVDHGTALELASTGRAESSSLWEAVELAAQMARIKGFF